MVCAKPHADPAVLVSFMFSLPVRPSAFTQQRIGKRLEEHHLRELRASGISDKVILNSRICSLDGALGNWVLNWPPDRPDAGCGWAIPFDDPQSTNCYWRVKLDRPRELDGRVIKYESPVGGSNRAYFPPGFDSSEGTPIVITEGEKKALSAVSHGINCAATTGCWNYQKPRRRDDAGRAYGTRHLIDDLAAINWKDRDVIICYDSDAAEKRSVELAQQKLAEALAKRGANVRVARLPAGDTGQKLGLDDAIVQLGIDAVRKILLAAEEPELPKLSWPDLARLLIEEEFSFGVDRTLQFWRDTFWRWTGRHYEEITEKTIAIAAYRFLERIAWSPTRYAASEVVAALNAEVELDSSIEPPCDLEPLEAAPLGTPLVFANEVVFADFDRCTAGEPLAGDSPSPLWFCTGSRDYAYDALATCPTWDTFLASSLPDADARRLLQQWAGYLISGRLDQHKLLVLLGADRAGKSLIASTLARIVGECATATSTLKEIGGDFGLSPFLGKQLLLIPDAADRGSCLSAVERLKSITGCDGLSVNRKHLPILSNVRLQTRIIINGNQLPRFLDVSGALFRRLLLINFEISFAGREDRTLPGRIKQELPGIFNWALEGWVDLRQTGHFIEPASSRDVLAEAEGVFSPMSTFLNECCVIDANSQIAIDAVWSAWQRWCKNAGCQPGGKPKLGTDLRGCLPGIKRLQLRVNGRQAHFYQGLDLNDYGRALCEEWARTEYRRA